MLARRRVFASACLLVSSLPSCASDDADTCDSGQSGSECSAQASAACGGWECTDLQALPESVAFRRGESSFCDVPSFDAEDVPREHFGDPDWVHRPFILRGDPATLRQQKQLGKQALLDAARQHKFQADHGYSWDIVFSSGTGPSKVSLHDFVSNSLHQDQYDGNTLLERPYLFGRHKALTQTLGLSVPVHDFIRSWSTNRTFESPQADISIVLVGGPRSGVGFHRHAAAIQTTVYGSKRWLLYPPDKNPPGGMKGDWPIYDWLQTVYPTLPAEQAPVECVQGPGDVLYIPEGWYHAVLNLADSVALSAQNDGFMNKSMQITSKIRGTKSAAQRLVRARKAAQMLQSSHEGQFDLFEALKFANETQEAFDVIVKLAQADPLFVFAQQAVFDMAKNNGQKDILLPMLSDFKPHLERNGRSLSANWLLSYYHLLSNDMAKALEYFRRNAALQALGVTRGDAPSFHDMAESLAAKF